MIYIYNSSMEREIDNFPRWNIWKHWEERVQTQSRSKASGTAERRRSSSSSSSRCWRYTCPRARARVVRASKRRIPRRLLIPNNEPASSRVPGGGAARRLETWSSEERAREGRRGREGERGRARAASSPSNISRLTHGYDSIVRRRRRRDARASFVATALTRNSVCLAEFNRKSSRVSFPPILNFPRNVSINVFQVSFLMSILFRVKEETRKIVVTILFIKNSFLIEIHSKSIWKKCYFYWRCSFLKLYSIRYYWKKEKEKNRLKFRKIEEYIYILSFHCCENDSVYSDLAVGHRPTVSRNRYETRECANTPS